LLTVFVDIYDFLCNMTRQKILNINKKGFKMVLPTAVGTNAYGERALVIEITDKDNPKCISAESTKEFYELVETNLTVKEFVVTRSKPMMNIADHACFANFIYDVDLFNRHLCTVFAFSTFYVIEIQGQFYRDRDLEYWARKKHKNIGDMVQYRWETDEENRKQKRKEQTNADNMSFFKSFATEKSEKNFEIEQKIRQKEQKASAIRAEARAEGWVKYER